MRRQRKGAVFCCNLVLSDYNVLDDSVGYICPTSVIAIAVQALSKDAQGEAGWKSDKLDAGSSIRE